MIFFAANSVLARLALRGDEIDGGSFTAVRICSGAVALALLVRARGEGFAVLQRNGSWMAALALFVYAVAFSLAYLSLNAGVGALILFAAVQITMIGIGMTRGERPRASEWLGLTLASGGLVYLLSPGFAAPPLAGAMLMASSGIAWGWYSLAAKGIRSPTAATAGNFVRAAPMAAVAVLGIWVTGQPHASWFGLELA
jgi:drug/metabolite transporter (DMT)-like permease